jgi:glycerophosphoryl diester phosphodiesterase
VGRLQSAGFRVSVWGANSLTSMKGLVSDGVDEIVTYNADVFQRWRTG